MNLKDRKDLAMEIELHSRLMLADIDTFVWLKMDQKSLYDSTAKQLGIGGGNFLSVLGLFSILDYLAQIYTVLRLGNIPKKRKGVIQPETEQFERVCKLLSDSVGNWRLTKSQIRKSWDFFRNEITHRAYPKSIIFTVTFGDIRNFTEFSNVDLLKLSPEASPFGFDSNGKPFCLVEVFNLNIKKIIIWLSNEIENNLIYTQINIDNVANWILNTQE